MKVTFTKILRNDLDQPCVTGTFLQTALLLIDGVTYYKLPRKSFERCLNV